MSYSCKAISLGYKKINSSTVICSLITEKFGLVSYLIKGFQSKKSKTKIKDNVFIGSNTSLVAPVTINENSVVGAGSVITRKVTKKSLALTRAKQIEIKNYKRK